MICILERYKDPNIETFYKVYLGIRLLVSCYIIFLTGWNCLFRLCGFQVTSSANDQSTFDLHSAICTSFVDYKYFDVFIDG